MSDFATEAVNFLLENMLLFWLTWHVVLLGVCVAYRMRLET